MYLAALEVKNWERALTHWKVNKTKKEKKGKHKH